MRIPRLIEMLFGSGGSKAERQAALRRRASLLDFVREDMASLKRELGAGDRDRVDGYLESVREVERRLQAAEAGVRENPLPDLSGRRVLVVDDNEMALRSLLSCIKSTGAMPVSATTPDTTTAPARVRARPSWGDAFAP